MNPNRLQPEPLDHEIAELQGYLGLGMRRQCLALARRILKRPVLTTEAFSEAVDAVLIQAGDLRRWQPRLGAAYYRVPHASRVQVRFKMLSFYVASEDWKIAEAFIPAKCENATELLFVMWTLLELRREHAASLHVRRCQRFLLLLQKNAPSPMECELELSAWVRRNEWRAQ